MHIESGTTNPFKIKSPESIPTKPDLKVIEKDFLEALLLKHAQRINEGNNGIIFSFSAANMSPEAIQFLKKLNILDPKEGPDRVVKILKIQTPGKMQAEHLVFQQAWKHVHPHVEQQTGMYADIPQPRFFGEIDITESLRKEFLEMHNISIEGTKIELLVMDQVPGTDMDSILLREFLLRSPNTLFEQKPDLITNFTHEELEELSAKALGYNFPFDQPRVQWTSHNWATYAQFRTKLFNLLHERGFRIDPHIMSAVERSFNVLINEANVVWGDGNLRNIMIEEAPHWKDDAKGLKGQPWLIDFGGADFTNASLDPERTKKEFRTVINRLHIFAEHPHIERSMRYTEAERSDLMKRSKMTGAIINRLVSTLKTSSSISIPQLIKNICGSDWVHDVIRALYQYSSIDEQHKSQTIALVESWLNGDPKSAHLLTSIQARNALQQLISSLSF